MMPHLQEAVIVQPQIMEQKCLARALYDNIAESPDELAFRRGEVLVVLEQNPVGLQGWWLCALRGRQGICPGNRLRLVPGVYADTGQGLTNNVGESLDQTTDITMLQQHGKRRSWHVQPNKVVTPKKHVDVYLYDLPPSSTTPTPTSSRCSSSQNYSVPSQRYPSDICDQNNTNIIQNTNHDNNATLEANLAAYDVPPRAVPINYDIPRNWRNSPAPSVPQSPLPTNSPCPTTNYSYPSLPPHRSAHSPLPPVPTYLDHTQQSRYSPNSNPTAHPCPTNGDDISRSSSRRDSIDSSSYDVPRPLLFSQHLISPSSSASSLTTGDSFSSSNRSSLANMPDYDVPKPSLSLSQSGILNTNQTNQNGAQNGSQSSNGQNQQELQQSVYDVPGTTPHSITPVVTPTSNLSHSPHPQEGRGLPLELSSALETLARLDSEASGAVGRLLALAGGGARWRVRAHLEPRLLDIRLAATRLGAATHDLAEFADGTLGNAAQAPDKGLAAKLRPLVKALKDADCLIQKATNILDSQQWSIDVLSKPEVDEKESICKPPDALDQLIACSRSLTEDVRQIASFIQGNSTLLFKRTSPNNNNENGDWLEDYDYVSLESREAVAKEHAEIREQLPNKLKKGYDALLKNAELAATEKNETQNMDPNDKQLLTFYAAQCITHSNHLTHAIDAFLQTVEHNQPPKVFLAHGKFVVLSAHRLVHIGDTVHRNITKNDIKTNALNCANALSEALAASVTKTKRAALQFPSVTAVQEMVDSVVDISHLAKDLKMCLVEAAQQP